MRISELVVEHYDWMAAKARYYCADRVNAEDLTAETAYKCLVAGLKYDSKRDFKPWALAIMENIFKTQLMRRKRIMFSTINEACCFETDEGTDQRVSISMIKSIIDECARRSCCIDCVTLYADGYSYEEIAEMKDIPIGTTKSRISAGRKMLREMLDVYSY